MYLNGNPVGIYIYNNSRITKENNTVSFWISGFSADVSTVYSMDLLMDFHLNTEPLMNGSRMNLVLNGIPLTITGWSKELTWQAPNENYHTQREYRYHWEFRPVELTDYEVGFHDGYASGYTDGQTSCPECSGSTDCSSAITEAFESGYTNGYASGYSAGQADCESGCNDYLECRTAVSFDEDTVIPTPSGFSNYIFYDLDMGYTFIYGAEGWEHNGEDLHSVVFNGVTLPAGMYEFRSILKQNGEWYTSQTGGVAFMPNDTIPSGVIGSRCYFREEQ